MHRTQQPIDRGLFHRAMQLTLLLMTAVITGLTTGIFAGLVGDLTFYLAVATGAVVGSATFTLGLKALKYLFRE